MRRVVFAALCCLFLAPVTADVVGASAGCPPDVVPGDLLIVRFAPALDPGSADVIDLQVIEDVDDLCGLVVSDGEGTLTFASLSVASGDVVRLVSDPDAILAPDPRVRHTIDWTAEDAPIDRKGRFALAKGGDHIAVSAGETMVDLVAYGDADAAGPGWTGAATEASRVDRRVFLRGLDGGAPVDTDTAADWTFPRVYRQHQVDTRSVWADVAGPVRAFVCPDRCFEEVMLRVGAATRSIDVNLYDLSLKEMVDALAGAAARGVALRILVHDRPVGASAAQMDRIADAVDRLVDAGAEVHTLERLRYDVNHAKYLVVDDEWTVVLSENANRNGWASDGRAGNRGWGVAVADVPLAAAVKGVFELDFGHPHDARPVRGDDLHPDAQPAQWGAGDPHAAEGRHPTLVLGPGEAVRARIVLAPDHLGDPGSSPLVAALAAAEEEVWVQQLNLPLDWKRPGHHAQSPLVGALIDAAVRGVPVRGTLADAFEDGDPTTPGNDQTVAVLGAVEGIDLRLGGAPDGRLVHNKGWIVDPEGRGLVVVGSANGNLASQTLNREVALFLEHPTVAAYYAAVLAEDHLRATGGAIGAEDPEGAVAWAPGAGALLTVATGVLVVFAAGLSARASTSGRGRSFDMGLLRRRPRHR